MTLETPVWQAFDPATDDVPASILALLDGDGPVRVLALAVAPTAEDGAWAAAASVKIARTAAAQGARALLLDLGLEGSPLPAELGVTPGEGISDIFEFGASARRVSIGVHEGAFLFVPAGTVVGDSSKIMEHPRWEAVLAGYRKSGTLVLLHVPLSLEGAATLLERADAVVFLAGAQAPAETLLEATTEVHAVLGPPDADEGAEAVPVGVAGADDQPDSAADEAKLESPVEAASLELLLSESLEAGEEAPIQGTPEEPAFEVPEQEPDEATPGPDWLAEAEPVPGEATDLEPDPFWGEPAAGKDSSVAADEDHRAADSGPHGPERAPLASEFEDPTVAESDPGGGGRRRLLLFLALIVIAAVVVVVLMRGGGEPALSGGPVDATGEVPIEVSAARSAGPDMTAAERVPSAGQDEVASGAGGEPAAAETTGASEGEAGPPVTPPADSPPADLSPSALMRFGLTINAHERQAAAEDQARDLRARFPSLHFILVPVQVRGATYYRVVAGPAASGDDAERIRAELAGYIGSAVARGAIVRSTRVAFLLGEYESLDEAMTRRGQAEDAGIPAYFAEWGPPEGPLRYRVYAGAYASAREADHLQTLLIESGITGAILTERMGRPLR